MTVNELIEELKKYPYDAEVKVYACGNGAQEFMGIDKYECDCDGVKHTTVYLNGEDYV